MAAAPLSFSAAMKTMCGARCSAPMDNESSPLPWTAPPGFGRPMAAPLLSFSAAMKTMCGARCSAPMDTESSPLQTMVPRESGISTSNDLSQPRVITLAATSPARSGRASSPTSPTAKPARSGPLRPQTPSNHSQHFPRPHSPRSAAISSAPLAQRVPQHGGFDVHAASFVGASHQAWVSRASTNSHQ